jgi:hypothetical protein
VTHLPPPPLSDVAVVRATIIAPARRCCYPAGVHYCSAAGVDGRLLVVVVVGLVFAREGARQNRRQVMRSTDVCVCQYRFELYQHSMLFSFF